ncbi:hypothetical protein UMC2_15881 [[Clostridium] sordellii]|nr:hypothetical protein UMC2_15881 [[Clostridium] sordellii] [Paeniclostridium sordellii]
MDVVSNKELIQLICILFILAGFYIIKGYIRK